MPGPRASGDRLHFRLRKWCLSPLLPSFATLLLSACASSPPPRPLSHPAIDPPPPVLVRDADPGDWDGSGGASNMRSRGEALADFAMRLRGSPYRYGGATIDGFDCSGLVFYAHRALGLAVPRTSRDQADQSTGVKAKKLRPGDLVFFKIGSRRVNHVGIYVGDNRFVHAPGQGKSVTTSSLDDAFYAQRFFSAGRYWNRLPQ